MKIFPPKPFLALALTAMTAGLSAPARAFSPYLVVPDPAVAEASPAYRYANMSDGEAFEELDRRKILYTKLDATPGVRAPVRLTGRLHGVYIHSSLPPDERVKTPFEILDARLALTLDDFAAILERHDIDEVIHYTMYRPNVGRPRTTSTRSRRRAPRASGRARRTWSRALPGGAERQGTCVEGREAARAAEPRPQRHARRHQARRARDSEPEAEAG